MKAGATGCCGLPSTVLRTELKSSVGVEQAHSPQATSQAPGERFFFYINKFVFCERERTCVGQKTTFTPLFSPSTTLRRGLSYFCCMLYTRLAGLAASRKFSGLTIAVLGLQLHLLVVVVVLDIKFRSSALNWLYNCTMEY